MELYFFPFLQSFLVSVGLILIIRRFKLPAVGPSLRSQANRHINDQGISRLGGAAVILSFWGILIWNQNLFFSQAIWGMAIGSLAILFFGIWDDYKEINWKIQLLFQIMLAVFVYFMGIKTDQIAGGMISFNAVWNGLAFAIVWLMVSINSMNWLDGTDGLSGGVALLGAGTIFLLALKPEVNQPPVAIISAVLAGAILGFLLFNFPPAHVMAGTSGSMFFGFVLGALAIFAGAKLATALLVMAMPIVDFIWVIGARLQAGTSIFEADQRHLHHRLLKLGWSQTKIALFFYAITLGLAVLALNTRLTGKLSAIIFSLILIAGARWVVERKLKANAL